MMIEKAVGGAHPTADALISPRFRFVFWRSPDVWYSLSSCELAWARLSLLSRVCDPCVPASLRETS
jgi:hypothetical protein